MKFVSPGVYVREIDLSLYIPALSTTIAGMVGTATKGPVNELTYITNVNQFIATFGSPSPDHMMPYAALQFLRRGNQLWVVRVAGTDAASATTDVNAIFNNYIRSSAAVASGVQSFTISADNEITFEVTDSRTATPTVVTKTVDITYSAYPVTVTADSLALKLADILKAEPSLYKYVTARSIESTVLTVEANRLHIVPLVPSPLVTVKITAATAGLSLASLAAPANLAAVGGAGSGSLTAGAKGYKVTAVKGRGETIASTEDVVTLVAETSVDLSWDAVVGAESYKVYGRTSGGPWGFIASVAAPVVTYVDLGVIVPSVTVLAPTTNTTASATPIDLAVEFEIRALSNGTWGNNLTIQSTLSERQLLRFDLGVYESTPAFTASTSTNESYKGVRVELFTALSMADSTGAAYIADVVGSINAAGLAPEYEAGNSKYITFRIDNADDVFALITEGAAYNELVMPESTFTTLRGGDDGLDSLTDADIIGLTVGNTVTGMQLFRNPESIDLNLVMAPGETSPAILNEIIAICEFRGDCMAILDTPDNYSVQQVVDWHNGAGAFSDHQAFSSSYAAMYYPWIKVYDAYNAVEVWTPPCGHVAGVYAYTDFISETWFAPAGFNRAHIVAGIQVRYSPDQGERELMYGNGNAVNPIVQFPKDGITVWGQRTLQRAPTALDRVNVRRLLLYMRKVVATAVKYLVFEPNDPITWRTFINLVTPFCQTVQSRRGIYDFAVVCDETTNTPDLIDQNTMVGRIYLKPTKAAEIINVDFVISNTGTSFSEEVF